MVERQAHSPVLERNGIVERSGNGLRRDIIPYSPILEREKKKNFIEIVLDRTEKKFEELPAEIAKTMIIVEDLKNSETGDKISTADKFRVAGYLFWEIEGKFDLVKTYLGENAGPKWESLLNEVWNRQELRQIRSLAVKERRFLDKIIQRSVVGNSPEGILEVYRGNIQYQRKKGKTDDEIFDDRENFLRTVNRYLKKDLRDRVLMKRREIKKGNITIKEGKTVEEISYEMGLSEGRTERIISALIFLGKIKPVQGAKKHSEQFKQFCLEVEKITLEHPEWRYQEIGNNLHTSIQRVRRARMILIEAGRLQNAKHIREPHRDQKTKEDERAIINLRKSNPGMSYREIAELLHLPFSRVAHYIKRGIDSGEIKRSYQLKNEELEPKLRKKIEEHLKQTPNKYFLFEPVSREIGASSETLKKIYKRLQSEFPDLKVISTVIF